jgi:hypothetical protein
MDNLENTYQWLQVRSMRQRLAMYVGRCMLRRQPTEAGSCWVKSRDRHHLMPVQLMSTWRRPP